MCCFIEPPMTIYQQHTRCVMQPVSQLCEIPSWNALFPAVRLPQVWPELTAGILWTLPGLPRECLGSPAPEDQRPPRLPPALPLPTRPWGQRRSPRRNRRPPRRSTWPPAVSSSPITRVTSAAWWMSISPGPSAATWMEKANGGHQNKARVQIQNFSILKYPFIRATDIYCAAELFFVACMHFWEI